MTKKAWLAATLLVLFLAGGLLLREALDLDWSVASVRALVDGVGVWAPILFIGLVTFRLAIAIPSQILLAAAGLLFGAKLGAVYGATGMTLSALLCFGVVRVAGVDAIRGRLPRRLDGAVAAARSHAGAGALAIATGYPFGPISAIQAGAALTGMSLVSYAVAVTAGSAVRAATYSYFGSTLFEGRHLLVGAAVVVVAAVVPLLFPASRARLAALFRGTRSLPGS